MGERQHWLLLHITRINGFLGHEVRFRGAYTKLDAIQQHIKYHLRPCEPGAGYPRLRPTCRQEVLIDRTCN